MDRWFECYFSRVDKDGRFIATVFKDITNRKRADAALRESEARHRLLIRSFAQAVWETNGSDVVIEDSSSWRRYTGQILDEWLGYGWLDAIHPEDRDQVQRQWRNAIVTRNFVNIDYRLRAPGGGWHWTNVLAAPVLDAEGSIEKWVGMNVDIHARKQVDTTLRESKERQDFLLELSDAFRAEGDAEAIGVLATRMVAEYFKVERSYICRYEQEEGLGWIGPEYRSSTLPSLAGEYRITDFPEGMKRLETGPLIIRDLFTDASMSEADKHSMGVVLGLAAMLAAVLRKGANTAIWCLVAATTRPRDWLDDDLKFLEDVAERTWAAMERARVAHDLQESEARFQQFAQASSGALWVRDAGTLELEYASPAMTTIHGVQSGSCLRELQSWSAMILPEDRATAVEQIERARLGEAVSHEFRIQRALDGSFRWIRSTNFPLGDSGHVIRIGGIAEDVTDTRLAVEHQGILLAELQHRVRNTMGIIRSMANRTALGARDVEDYRSLLEGRLLALARVQALLTRQANAGGSFRDVVHDEDSAQAHHYGQFELLGPDVTLAPKAVEVLTLAFHELATNAAQIWRALQA